MKVFKTAVGNFEDMYRKTVSKSRQNKMFAFSKQSCSYQHDKQMARLFVHNFAINSNETLPKIYKFAQNPKKLGKIFYISLNLLTLLLNQFYKARVRCEFLLSHFIKHN